MSVAVLFQNKDLPDELLLRYIDAQRPETGELMSRIILCGQYDGLCTNGEKSSRWAMTMLEATK